MVAPSTNPRARARGGWTLNDRTHAIRLNFLLGQGRFIHFESDSLDRAGSNARCYTHHVRMHRIARSLGVPAGRGHFHGVMRSQSNRETCM
jgi:hypothetical protein